MKFLYHKLRQNYRLLSPDATMLVELWSLNINDIPLDKEQIEAWKNSLNNQFSGALKIDYIFILNNYD